MANPPPAAVPQQNPPQPRPKIAAYPMRPPSRGAWTFFAFFLAALALIGGVVAAHYCPDIALSFRQIVGDVRGKLPESATPELLLQVAGGAAFVLVAILIWQAGRFRRPLFWAISLFLCLVASAAGLYRGGHDVDLERNAARVRTLESDLGTLQQKLDKATGSLQQSSLTIQERDGTLSTLRKEIEELKKKLEEKKPEEKN